MPGCYYWRWGNNHAHCANAVSEYLGYGSHILVVQCNTQTNSEAILQQCMYACGGSIPSDKEGGGGGGGLKKKNFLGPSGLSLVLK